MKRRRITLSVLIVVATALCSPAGAFAGPTLPPLDGGFVYDLSVDPTTGDVYVSTGSSLYRRTGDTFSPVARGWFSNSTSDNATAFANGKVMISSGYSSHQSVIVDVASRIVQPLPGLNGVNIFSLAGDAQGNFYGLVVEGDSNTQIAKVYGISGADGTLDPLTNATGQFSGGIAIRHSTGDLYATTLNLNEFDGSTSTINGFRILATDLNAALVSSPAQVLFAGKVAQGSAPITVTNSGLLWFSTGKGIGYYHPAFDGIVNVLGSIRTNPFLGPSEFNGLAYDPTSNRIYFAKRTLSAELSTHHFELEAITAQRAPLGDANFDHRVNFRDFVVLSNNFMRGPREWTHGNFNLDNRVNFEDFVILSNNFGFPFVALTSDISGTLIPEPTSAALLCLAALGLCRQRRCTTPPRRSQHVPHANGPSVPRSRHGFTLTELLISVVVIAVLLTILLPAVARKRSEAHQTICAKQQQQMALATFFYLEDNDQSFFPRRAPATVDGKDGTLWWFGFEADASRLLGQGNRVLDRSLGKMYNYHHSPETVRICPGFMKANQPYKPKYKSFWTTYGYDATFITEMGPVQYTQIDQPDKIAMLTDTAQVNSWQAPASTSNPMIEEWDYFTATGYFVHYRHNGRANVLLADGHVETKHADTGFDPWLPEAMTGRPPADMQLIVSPWGAWDEH